jgi:hypothetical protein
VLARTLVRHNACFPEHCCLGLGKIGQRHIIDEVNGHLSNFPEVFLELQVELNVIDSVFDEHFQARLGRHERHL